MTFLLMVTFIFSMVAAKLNIVTGILEGISTLGQYAISKRSRGNDGFSGSKNSKEMSH
jgi:hypothetical protein